jgi:MoaA/NifB/PqqE/SkfB family radical SAM enzyme
MLAIEIIEGCNFKCYFCTAKDVPSPVYMDFDLFKKIVLQAKKIGIKKLNLTPCKGEPFMHPNIYEILQFANEHMEESLLFSNATAINVKKLKSVKLNNIRLCISQYGKTIEDFIHLTKTNKSLYDIFQRRLQELKSEKIPYEIHMRDVDYQFDFVGNQNNVIDVKKIDKKCKYHHEPKVFVNGDVTFCIFAREEILNNKKIFFANVNELPLKDILEHPLRFKFYDSQSLCFNHNCTSYDKNCYVKHSLLSIKLLSQSKKNYILNKEFIDSEYMKIENN